MTIDQIKELAGHREVSPWVIKLVQDAVEIEREACAKVVDEWNWSSKHGSHVACNRLACFFKAVASKWATWFCRSSHQSKE